MAPHIATFFASHVLTRHDHSNSNSLSRIASSSPSLRPHIRTHMPQRVFALSHNTAPSTSSLSTQSSVKMDANLQPRHDIGIATASKPRGKARARSKSLAELPAEIPPPPPPLAPPTVLRKIPRPPNAFILYRSHKMRELKGQKNSSAVADNGLDKLDHQRRLSKVIGELWRNEAAEVKAAFYEKAHQAAKEHAERYPEYRFKPANVKKCESQDAGPPIIDRTPEKRENADFSPGDISGPLSGSGSGSGRKRASLDGARSKASPYSTTRHRRASSTAPVSPTAHYAHRRVAQEHAPVLLYSPDDPQASFLSESLSYGPSGQIPTSSVRTATSPARRSLDGHMAYAASTSHSFDTLVPQHLRAPQVFLAPLPAPPMPIGQAITTDEPATPTGPGYTKPKCSLYEAVKSALPPERRAFLQASLVMRGLAPVLDPELPSSSVKEDLTSHHAIASQPAPKLEQPDFWSSTTGSTYEPYTQEPSSGLSSQTSYTTTPSSSQKSTVSSDLQPTHQSQTYPDQHSSHQPQTYPNHYPTNQAQTYPDQYPVYQSQPYPEQPGHSVNLHMGPSVAQAYGGLGDWVPPEPCWLDYAQPGTATGYDTQYAQPANTFSTIDAASTSYSDAPPAPFYDINASNSAFVALSDPDETGQVQGNMYNFDGQLVGQGVVSGEGGEVDEETRQRRALDQLLMQMMQPLQPGLAGEGGSHTHTGAVSTTIEPTPQAVSQPAPSTIAPVELEQPPSQPAASTQAGLHQTLRSWKANQLNSLKDKLARVTHRTSPSTSGPQS